MNWDRVERLWGAETLAFLRRRRVAIIGLGSGGGFVATALAMSGISRFVLIDDDVLEAHNVVRHVGDLRDVGCPKVEIVRDLISQRNSETEIIAIKGCIEDHQDSLDEVDLVISAVDGEGTKYLINEICLAKNKAAIYAGVYERGEGGDVAMIVPFAGPCYACWAANLRQGDMLPSPDGSGKLDYGLLNEQGTLDAEPGLWLHVVRVASTQADLALNMLVKDTSAHRALPGNTVILANREIEIFKGRSTPPHSAEWITIERDSGCFVCGERNHASASDDLSLDALAGDILRLEDNEADRFKGK